MIRMKSLISGNLGDGASKVRRGREFHVATEARAKELESAGLAFRVEKAEPAPLNKMEPAPLNKAADAGPLGSPGGTTGAEEPAPSSPPVRPRRRRGLISSGGGSQS